MSYKFQRLREKLRRGDRSRRVLGKLPGERTLAKRFHVNAKTLSKALTDLAAEGLLDRSIGRGTYVKGSAPRADRTGVAHPDRRCRRAMASSGRLIDLLKIDNPELHVAMSRARPRCGRAF